MGAQGEGVFLRKRKDMASKVNNQETLENQLHEQLAQNDNNRISTFITFIIGIFALFSAFGYVYVNTNICKDSKFHIGVFLLMSFVTIGILCFLSLLTLCFGYSFRRDQLIVHIIRKKRFSNDKIMIKAFDEIYSPLKEKDRDFLPDFYNLFYWLFLLSEIFLGVITIIKVLCIMQFEYCFCTCKNILSLFLYFICFLIFIFLSLKFRCCYSDKYNKRKVKCINLINQLPGMGSEKTITKE